MPAFASDADHPVPTPAAAPRAGRGRLKLFLGAAPGVGKTYEMLLDGLERRREGGDVVIAAAELHGRPEAEALAAGLERLPAPAHTPHAMDIDAVIARRPGLVLIDALARSNPPGSRHARRWQDAIELIERGIDVYATLDIREVESLHDVAARVTRAEAVETVPDHVLEAAEIEVIDLPPDELIRRLEEGKVRVPEEASRVLAHFFSRPVLTALREMLLRRAVLSVDRQMVSQLDQLDPQAAAATLSGGERVLVAVNELPGAEGLVRAAKRLADALRAPWTAIFIETPRALAFEEAQKRRVGDALRLASTLGATIATVPATGVVEGLLDQVAATRATQLVIGKSRRSWWFTLRHGSVVETMLRASDGLAVHVLPAREGPARPQEEARPTPARGRWGQPADYAAILGLVALTVLLCRLLEPVIGLNSIDLLFLAPTVAAAALFGMRPGLVAGVLAWASYGFFFLGPRSQPEVRDPQALVSLLVLLALSAVTARLTDKLRARATLGTRSAHENAAVASFAQTLARVSDRQSTADAICLEVARLLDVDTMLLAERGGALAPIASVPADLPLGPVDRAAAEWAWARGEEAGAGTATLSAADWRFVPLKTSLGTLALLGMARENGRDPVPADRAVLMSALIGQAALAHERLHLEDDLRDVTVLQERDRLRTSLLGSLSRGLLSPLALIADALAEAAAADPDAPRIAVARAEADRLRRLLDDLVDLVRIDRGELALAPEPVDLVDAVSDAAHAIHARLRDARIDLRIPPTLPRVSVDPRFLEHVLVNILSDAVRRGDARGTIVVEGRREPEAVALAVRHPLAEANDSIERTGFGAAIVARFAEVLGLAPETSDREGEAVTTIRFPAPLILPREPA